jgi:hypothetical protein
MNPFTAAANGERYWWQSEKPKLITCPECKSKDVDMTWITQTSLPDTLNIRTLSHDLRKCDR